MTPKRPFDSVLTYAVIFSAAVHLAVLHFHLLGFGTERNNDIRETELSYIVVREYDAFEESSELPAERDVSGGGEASDPPDEADPAGVAKEKAYAQYYDVVRAAIYSKLCTIPTGGAEGSVFVTFTLLPDGVLSRIDEARSSPTGAQAVRGIKMAQPFPPFPDELGGAPIRFSVCVTFPSS